MKHVIKYMTMAALALMGTMTSGCADEDNAIKAQQQTGNTVTLTTTISLDGSSSITRALDADGKKTFAAGDKIAIIYKNANDETMFEESNELTKDDISNNGKKAKITFDLTGKTPKAGGQLRYVYPALMAKSDVEPINDINDENTLHITDRLLVEQDGTLENLAKAFDLAVYDGNFTSEGELPLNATLKNKLAIVEFTINDNDDKDITSTITKLEIKQGPGLFSYEVNRTAAAGPIYVAMMPSKAANEAITITATDSKTTLMKTASNITLAANKIYPVTAKLLDMLHTPLTLEATEDDTEITVNNEDSKTIQYQINGKDKITITNTTNITGLKAGDIVQFFSTNASVYAESGKYLNIRPNKKTYVYGNVMSMIDDGTEGFANDKVIGADNALRCLFNSAAHIAFHDTKDLLLPATTLSKGCYQQMFSNCTGLTRLPENFLPATTLSDECYFGMFNICTGLKSLPKNLLPATSLTDECYFGMFVYCSGLTTVPENLLPATTLAYRCYGTMFAYCSGLTTVPENLLPATTLTEDCYLSMFYDCSSLEEAPKLPATTLTDGCYRQLFTGCAKLSSVTCLATDISANDCLENWLKDAGTAVTGEKKVYIMKTMVNGAWENDTDSGIPVGWTRVEM